MDLPCGDLSRASTSAVVPSMVQGGTSTLTTLPVERRGLLHDGRVSVASGIHRDRFRPANVYLDTPTYGLASDAVADALATSIDRWRRGVATMADYDASVARCRALFAGIVGTEVTRVAVANQVSVFVGLVASSLHPGSVVLVADDDFTSVLFPMLVQEQRGVTVRRAPFEDLAAAIDDEVDLVAFSLVHSATGRIADVAAIEQVAARGRTRLLVDATQAAGWLPIEASRYDYLVAGAYKWLLCPRGTAFMAVSPGAQDDVVPALAGWYAGEDPWTSIYGGALRLAASARRFDVSPAWLSWDGSVPALELIATTGVDRIHAHDVALADQARERLGLPSSSSAIVTIPMDRTDQLRERGIAAAVRAGSVRVGFHLYNSVADVDALVAVAAAS
jgi:selenocysteine lyase/cysteine desulfurase